MKKTITILMIFSVLFLFSCSNTFPAISDKSVLSSSLLGISQDVSATESIMSAYTNLPVQVEVVEEYDEDKNITVLRPILFNDYANITLSDFLKDKIYDSDIRDLKVDFFINSYQDAVSIVFFSSTDANSMLSITFSSDFTKVLDVEDFIISRNVTDYINETLLNLYNSSISDADNFFVHPQGIVLIDGLENQYLIPMELFLDTHNRKVVVGEKYLPVTDKNEKVIALTFDDGPNYYKTTKLLDILEKSNSKATFFTVGYNLEYNGALLRRMLALGCDVGIHSYGHQNYSTMKYDDIMADIELCSSIIEEQTGYSPYLVRAPFGKINSDVVSEKDYFYINWSVDPLDWQGASPEEIANHVISNATPGAIILLHDLYDASCQATEMIIKKMTADGWRFVTVSELFDLKDKTPSGEIYYRLEKQ